jgi:hypothetical protein
MHRLIAKKILVLLAIWLLTGGLALADSFDLTDELQHALFDRTIVLETDMDEVRESIGDTFAILGMRGQDQFLYTGVSSEIPRCSTLIVLAFMRPLPEVLKIFRI